MSELAELKERVNGARVMVKSARRTLQGLAQYLADLDERLEAFDGQPEGGTPHEQHLENGDGGWDSPSSVESRRAVAR